MANAKTHVGVAAGVGIASYVLYCTYNQRKFDFGEALLAVGACVLGGVAPDGLEPALNPWHRSLGHSVSAGAVSAGAVARSWTASGSGPGSNFLLLFFALGYFTHLVLDAGTPRGLPLLM
ncbi:MAG TPA: metal-dependent hydrolase [Candidatus Acidoferrum sp.]|nr:metal-dependent hydrolase [Candidatus Acidoferrum sp.]